MNLVEVLVLPCMLSTANFSHLYKIGVVCSNFFLPTITGPGVFEVLNYQILFEFGCLRVCQLNSLLCSPSVIESSESWLREFVTKGIWTRIFRY